VVSELQVDPQLLQGISILVAIISIIVAFIIGVRSIRNFAVSRKASVFISYQTQAYNQQFLLNLMEILNKWSWENFEDFWQKYGPQTNPDAYAKFISVSGFYEGMARLLKKKIIDIDLMPAVMSIGIIMFWDKIKPMSAQLAKQLGSTEGLHLAQFLNDRVKTRQLIHENHIE
jgi:hypothetical protein